jgi:hypothetical protein
VAEFAMNVVGNKSIQNTPFMLNYGQNPNTPTVASLRARNPKINGFVGRWSAQVMRAEACLRVAQERQKAYADRKHQAAPEFQVGDQVLTKVLHFRLRKELKAKLAPRYVGPFKVLERSGIAGLVYRIALPEVLWRVHPIFHVSSLKRYFILVTLVMGIINHLPYLSSWMESWNMKWNLLLPLEARENAASILCIGLAIPMNPHRKMRRIS